MIGARDPSAPPVRAFMSVKTQFDNLGDALINRELARLISAHAATTIDFSRCPDSFRQAMKLEASSNIRPLARFGYVRLLARMTTAAMAGTQCYFFLNPGGLGRRPLSRKQLRSGSLNNLLLWALRSLGVRVCLLGVSYDPLDSKSLKLTRERASLLHRLVVRDEASATYLRSVGIRVDAIMPDLSFGLYQEDGPSNKDRPTIAFSFRFDGLGARQIEAFVTAVMGHFGPEYRFAFVAQVGRDVGPMRSLEAVCQEATGFQTNFYACIDDIAKMGQYYAGCRAIFSNRLHALLLAAHASAAPVAAIDRTCDGKIIGLFDDMDLSDRIISLNDPQAVNACNLQSLDPFLMKAQYAKLSDYVEELVR